MEKNLEFLKWSALFQGIGQGELGELLHCLDARQQSFAKGAYIFRTGDKAGEVGVVLSGSVQVSKEDFTGNRTILAGIGQGDLFGESFACAGAERFPVNVTAAEASEILLINYRKVVSVCPDTCVFHGRLVQNMMRILAEKNVHLSQKIDIISRRTTRQKLIAFLSAQAQAAGGTIFTIPFDRQALADYLCVERSAMSAELGKLKHEGLLDFDRSKFTLYHTGP